MAAIAPGITPYRFGFNNPISQTDPSGLYEIGLNGMSLPAWAAGGLVSGFSMDSRASLEGIRYAEANHGFIEMAKDGFWVKTAKLEGAETWSEKENATSIVKKGTSRDIAIESKFFAETRIPLGIQLSLSNPMVQGIHQTQNQFMYGENGFLSWLGTVNPWSFAGGVSLFRGIGNGLAGGSKKLWNLFSTPAKGGIQVGPKSDKFLRYAAKVKPIEGFLDVAVHGSPNSIRIGSVRGLNHRVLAKIIQKNPQFKGQSIRLLSCSTGCLPKGFAKNLSNKLGVDVIAPNNTIWIDKYGRWSIGKQFWKNTGRFVGFSKGIKK